jgi:predicted kinase
MEKVVVIMRGVPGSGKSTVTNILKGLYNPEIAPSHISIHSTDDYFMRNGRYEWNRAELFQAHEWNKKEFEFAVRSSMHCVVVDNTNLTQKEYKPYIEMARKHGWKVVAVVFEPSDISIHAQRNIHSVPVESIMNMMTKLTNNINTVGVDEEILITAQMPLEEVKKVITEKFIRYCN